MISGTNLDDDIHKIMGCIWYIILNG
jgi:hypothetical protein